MANSLIKSGTRKGIFGQQFYTQEELDFFIANFDTYTEEMIEINYGFDMKTLALISSNDTYTTLLYKGEEITLPSQLINDLYASQDNTYSSVKIDEKLTAIVNAIGVDSGNGSSNMWQNVYLNVITGDTVSIGVPDGYTLEKVIVQVYKFVEGTQDVVEIIKKFDNTDATNFYCNLNSVGFTGVMKIKDAHELPKTLNASGYYETDTIDINDFVEMNGMEAL